MHLTFDGVNDAFKGVVSLIQNGGAEVFRSPSRSGDILSVADPVTVTYRRPRDRVLFNSARDANPFFHLFEALWMLAGRDDVQPLIYYNSKIAEIASDDGVTLNGAYGRRWRGRSPATDADMQDGLQGGTDQLPIIVDQLKRKPESRRCVLEMWNTRDDLLRIDQSKDVCCNTHAYFAVRERRLNMTVCNRSNDLVWGMLGTNFVHFSVLQEYLAACIGTEVGVYNHFTNNLHVYTARWRPEKYLADSTPNYYGDVEEATRVRERIALVRRPELFDAECKSFVENPRGVRWKEPFFSEVARPMTRAFDLHKTRDYQGALTCAREIASDDWRIASVLWIERRQRAWEAANQRHG